MGAVRTALAACACALSAVACTQSPLGHPQLHLVSDAELSQMGVEAFDEVKHELPQSRDRAVNAYVTCVANAVAKEADPNVSWEVRVFETPEINAFALPGGKIGVYTGILRVAETQDELAAVLGHEVSHVTAKHHNARVSAAMAAETGLALGQLLTGKPTAGKQATFAALGLGAEYGLLKPYGREQETEADLVGLDVMAKAGFDPRAAVQLWENMSRASQGKEPPTFLSTHPSHQGRIAEIERRMPQALAEHAAAERAGKHPSCETAAITKMSSPPGDR
jgi:predicted Zn-dependent protease